VTSRLALLINPRSGRGLTAAEVSSVHDRLAAGGLAVSVLSGHESAQFSALARDAVAAGYDILAVMGGDGSVHLALQAVVGSPTVLAVIPTGTGNDLARALGLPRNDLLAAADVIINGQPRSIDTAKAGERAFVTVLASGIDSRASERANTLRRPRGQLRYILATLAELRVFEPVHYTLTLDGFRLSVEAMLVAVGNTSSYGGGLRMCEGAEADDGLLDVVVIAPMSKLDLIKVYPRLLTGTHVRHSAYSRHQVRSVTLEATDVVAYADGERLGPLPITVEVAARSVDVMVTAA